jgi:hypothetical protein
MRFVTTTKQVTPPPIDAQVVGDFVSVYKQAISGLLAEMGDLTGGTGQILAGLPKFSEILRKWVNPIKKAVDNGGVTQERIISKTAKVNWKFDLVDPRAVAYAQDRGGALVVEITDEVKSQISQLVSDAMTNGVPARELASQISRTVGLHSKWARAVENFHERTLTDLLKKMPQETAAAKAEKMTQAYRARLIKSRATTIARTELSKGMNHGRFVSWLQAIDDGTIDPNTAGKRWLVARPCDVCAPLNGQTVGVLDWFKNKDGEEKYNMPPVHPNCKCTAVLIPNWKSSTAPVSKGRERKYATRREAAQAAARARWGDKAVTAPSSKWTTCKTTDEAEAQWNKTHPTCRALFKGMDVAAANELGHTMGELFDAFPEVASKIKMVGYGPAISEHLYLPQYWRSSDRNAYGSALSPTNSSGYPSFIKINCKPDTGVEPAADWYGTKSTEFQQSKERSVQSGWFSKGILDRPALYHSGVRSTIVHEFGHQIDFSLGSDNGQPNDKAKKSIVRKFTNNFHKTHPELATRTPKMVLKQDLSGYSAKNYKETYAEAFAEWYLSPSPRPLATALIEGTFAAAGKTLPARPLQKARPRKYATRSEAAQAAARARWGDRAAEIAHAYRQEAVTSPRAEPVDVPTRAEYIGYASAPSVLDTVLTESVQKFDEAAFLKAVAKGPVSIVGIHSKFGMEQDLVFGEDARGGGLAGPGLYSSLITDMGINSQILSYQRRGRQALLRCDLQKPMVITDDDMLKDIGKWSGGHYDYVGLMKALMDTGMSKNDAYDEIRNRNNNDEFYQPVKGLKELGYDSIVVVGKQSMVSMFDGSKVKVIDPVLTEQERDLVYAVGQTVSKASDLPFDGRGFVYVEINALTGTVTKARPRKYATRSEAARAAANARWGNRAAEVAYAYRQEAVISPRKTPVTVETLNSDYRSEDAAKTIVDQVLTESVQSFDSGSFMSAIDNGPVMLVGVHATDNFQTSFQFGDEPKGGGNLGTGTYASLIDPTGIANQTRYQERGRQLLVSVSLKNPIVVLKEDSRLPLLNVSQIAVLTVLEKKGLATGNETSSDLISLVQKNMPPIQSADDFKPNMDLMTSYLSRTGYDGIVLLAKPSNTGFTALGLGSQVSVFSGKQIKIIDPVLTADERKIVYEAGTGITKAIYKEFDGRDFDLVSLDALVNTDITKARPRKYATRSEAARAAANARWGSHTPFAKYGVDSRAFPSPKLDQLMTDYIDATGKAGWLQFAWTYPEETRKWQDDLRNFYNGDNVKVQTHMERHFMELRGREYIERNEAPDGLVKQCERKLVDVIENNPIVTNMSYETLNAVFADGRLKTQFETQTSTGSLDPRRRREAEALNFGLPISTPDLDRPVYGSIEDGYPNFGSGGTWAYGHVRLVMKDSVKDRASFTTNDTLNNVDRVSPVRNPNPRAARIMSENSAKEPWSAYIETQIYGGVKTTDIAEVVIRLRNHWGRTQLAQHEGVKAALKMGIKVRVIDVDGKLSEYKGES